MSINDMEKMKKFLEEKKSKGGYLQAEKKIGSGKIEKMNKSIGLEFTRPNKISQQIVCDMEIATGSIALFAAKASPEVQAASFLFSQAIQKVVFRCNEQRNRKNEYLIYKKREG